MKALTRSLFLLLSLSALPALGQTLYQVEVLLFSQSGSPLYSAPMPQYQWADEAVWAERDNNADVRPVSETLLRMTGQADRLRQGGSSILLHQAWVQPADGNLTVAVAKGEPLDEVFPVQALISLQRDRFVELDATFWRNHIDRESRNLAASERLSEQRRLRLDEVHYLDHQSIGALVRVSRR
ncbi:CsiV family protein [Halopseudomonas salegens]|uniref:Peptidoglycan-binding protein, CsiV n=1 Tax=Halopseudomonas salegens TaxID=1434072 RepID=A0A1H2EWX6_9GAMM|nr:CsiV family protein [Halopseudomonas salegens]SDT99640.1 Peptidoglycan-binding protein, CsiV [Halopseudomonas salegens]